MKKDLYHKIIQTEWILFLLSVICSKQINFYLAFFKVNEFLVRKKCNAATALHGTDIIQRRIFIQPTVVQPFMNN